jgi:hypothetical protein
VAVVGSQEELGSAGNAAVERIVEQVSARMAVSEVYPEAIVLIVAAVVAELAVAGIAETCVFHVPAGQFELLWLLLQQDRRVNFDRVVSLEAEEPLQIEFQVVH